jgi:hypothetical protein
MTQAELIEKIKLRLGIELIDVELTDDEIKECIGDATDKFVRRHYNGSERSVYKLDIVLGQMQYKLPDYIHAVTSYYKFNEFSTPNLQRLVLTELNIMYESSNLINFAVFKDYIKTIEKILMPNYDFTYNSTTKNIFFRHKPVIEPFEIYLEVFTDVSQTDAESMYDNQWFIKYSTELSRLRWAQIVGKYTKKLTNGAEYNYEFMYNQAVDAIEKLEEELETQFANIIDFFVD